MFLKKVLNPCGKMKQTDSGENGSFVYVKDYHPVVGKLLLPQLTMYNVTIIKNRNWRIASKWNFK